MGGHHVYLEVSAEKEGSGSSMQSNPFDKDSERSKSDNSDTEGSDKDDTVSDGTCLKFSSVCHIFL